MQMLIALDSCWKRKSTSGMAHFLGPCLVSWVTKKQHSVSMSTAKAEYVTAASCYTQLL